MTDKEIQMNIDKCLSKILTERQQTSKYSTDRELEVLRLIEICTSLSMLSNNKIHNLRKILNECIKLKGTHPYIVKRMIKSIYRIDINALSSCDRHYKDHINEYKDQYHYIPSFWEHLCELFYYNNFHKGLSYIDIGGGIGDKVLLMSLLSDNNKSTFHSLEISGFTDRIATSIFRHINDSRLESHFGSLDNYNIKNYDRIYTFKPLWEGNELYKFYSLIITEMNDECIWLEILPNDILMDVIKSFCQSTKIQLKIINDNKNKYNAFFIKKEEKSITINVDHKIEIPKMLMWKTEHANNNNVDVYTIDFRDNVKEL